MSTADPNGLLFATGLYGAELDPLSPLASPDDRVDSFSRPKSGLHHIHARHEGRPREAQNPLEFLCIRRLFARKPQSAYPWIDENAAMLLKSRSTCHQLVYRSVSVSEYLPAKDTRRGS